MSLFIRQLSPFGAEVIGLDLDDEHALDDATRRALLDAWVEHGILLFRNALHSEAAHLRLSRVFGDPQPSAVSRINDAKNPYLMTLEQRPSDASKETFTLFEIEGLSHAEIGSILGISEGNSKWILFATKKELQEKWRKQK